MSPGSRCDEILRLIDEVLGDAAGPGTPVGPVSAGAGPVEPAAVLADPRLSAAAR